MPAGFYIGNSDGTGINAAADLGWVDKPHIAVTDHATGIQAEIVPNIPCTLVGEGGGFVSQTFTQNVFGVESSYPIVANYDVYYTCVVNGQVIDLHLNGPSGEAVRLRAGTGVGYGGRTGGTILPSNCPLLQSARIVVSLVVENSSPLAFTTAATWIWQASGWTTSTGGWTPATTAAGVAPAGSENPIVCAINNTGADIFAIVSNVMSSVFAWVPCMLIPVGWDRGQKIPIAWTTGPFGELTAAFNASVPHGIVCGAVGSIPFYGRTIGLDTCQADFAPGYVKNVVGWVVVLGLCALGVRRIMWAVGSRA